MIKQDSQSSILFVHWHADEVEQLAAPLRQKGWNVQTVHDGRLLKLSQLRASPPEAVIISLRRLPSHSRYMAKTIWETKWGKKIPVIFFDGKEDKVAMTQKQFPKAAFAKYEDLEQEIEKILE